MTTRRNQDAMGRLQEFLDVLNLDHAAEQHIIYLADAYAQKRVEEKLEMLVVIQRDHIKRGLVNKDVSKEAEGTLEWLKYELVRLNQTAEDKT